LEVNTLEQVPAWSSKFPGKFIDSFSHFSETAAYFIVI
jgi:hypothetical protein